MPNEEHFRKLERMYLGAPINEYFEPRIQISQGAAEITMAVRPDFFHAAHGVHGSVYFKALDDAAFFAVSSLVDDVFMFTVSFNIYLTRPISQGEMKSTGKVVQRSRRLFIAEAELFDSRGRTIGRGSGTFMCSEMPLDPSMGYK